ncbi:hypothetical protein V6N13_111364 [Hibiscus sabdariffa]
MAGKGPPITYDNLLKDEVTSSHPFRSTSLPVLSHNGVKERISVDSCPTHSVEVNESLRHVMQATEVGDTTATDASLNIQLHAVINRVENRSSVDVDELGTSSQQQCCPSMSNNVQGSRMDGSNTLQDFVANSSLGISNLLVVPSTDSQHKLSQVCSS